MKRITQVDGYHFLEQYQNGEWRVLASLGDAEDVLRVMDCVRSLRSVEIDVL